MGKTWNQITKDLGEVERDVFYAFYGKKAASTDDIYVICTENLGLERRQVRNGLYRLYQKGLIAYNGYGTWQRFAF